MPLIEETYVFGKKTFQSVAADGARKDHSMCYHCSKLKPKTPEHCQIAQQLYDLCVEFDMAMIITRCREWEPKDEHDS